MMVTENIDYRFCYEIESDYIVIELISSEWKGIKFKFGEISVEEKGEEALLHFEYDFWGDKAAENHKILKENTAFNEWIGLILNDIIMKEILKDKETNENRTNDSTTNTD